jgi:hypothetical protein
MRRLISILVFVVIAGGSVTSATAQIGIQGGYGGDTDWFIGARAELGTSAIFKNSRTSLDFNWFFPEGESTRYFDFNLNYHWPLAAVGEGSKPNLFFVLGLNVGRGWIKNLGDSDNWEAGMNLLGSLAYGIGTHAAFLEGGYTFFSDYDQWRIYTGFLF